MRVGLLVVDNIDLRLSRMTLPNALTSRVDTACSAVINLYQYVVLRVLESFVFQSLYIVSPIFTTFLYLTQCRPSLPHRLCSRKQKRKSIHLADGSVLPTPSTKRLGICTNKLQTLSNSTKLTKRREMLMHEKPSAERNAMKLTKLRMLGGMPQKPTNEVIQIVSSYDCTTTLFSDYFTVAIQALTQTITHLTKSGRFRQAADREKEIGQIYLQETNDIKRACESYHRAGDWYAQEDAQAYVPASSIATSRADDAKHCQCLL